MRWNIHPPATSGGLKYEVLLLQNNMNRASSTKYKMINHIVVTYTKMKFLC